MKAKGRIEKFLGGQSNPDANYTGEKNDGERGFRQLAIMVQ
jgi:hypothetical protein